MAFDAGETPKVYVFVLSIWTYPVAIGMARFVRKWEPAIVLLPGGDLRYAWSLDVIRIAVTAILHSYRC